MSGTSLDGLDLCYVKFHFRKNWRFEIIATKFIPYDAEMRKTLSNSHQLSAQHLECLHEEFGKFTAECVNGFIQKTNLPEPNLVCSHGHTVFHNPAKGITRQIGDGKIIAAETGITCISDFRTGDVSLGGQGAPLVPIGDELLFEDYDACLNLGGFSNISFKEQNERLAFDICPVNIILNPLANLLGKEYDSNGDFAKEGAVNQDLLRNLNCLKLYTSSPRPSLSREWLEESFIPIIEKDQSSALDRIATVTEHAAEQIAMVINHKVEDGKVLITGGGAKNTFFINRLKSLSTANIIVPEIELIDFKEALIFAFLGVLKFNNQTNVLRSVTGASRDSSSGRISLP